MHLVVIVCLVTCNIWYFCLSFSLLFFPSGSYSWYVVSLCAGVFVSVFCLGLFYYFCNCTWKANYRNHLRSKMKVCFSETYTLASAVYMEVPCTYLVASSSRFKIHSHWVIKETWAWLHHHMQAHSLTSSSPFWPRDGKEEPCRAATFRWCGALFLFPCVGRLLRKLKPLGTGHVIPRQRRFCGHLTLW